MMGEPKYPSGEADFYRGLDDFKLGAMKAGLETARNMDGRGVHEVTASRGESAQVIDLRDGRFLAVVNEELGTKNLVADAMEAITGQSYYMAIGLDTAAAQFNDLITVGARPISSQAHFITGDRTLFNDPRRSADLIAGYKEGCDIAGANWLGGETGLLEGVVEAGRVALSGSAVGIIPSKDQLILGDRLQPGDQIVYVASSGIHTNGLTDARKLAEQLPQGYATLLDNGQMYGEELLMHTPSYAPAVQALLEAGVDVHYMANITGHGWRKLMRARAEYTYVIENLPDQETVLFDFIQRNGGQTDRQMYETYNMGLGFAIYVAGGQANWVINLLDTDGWMAGLAGHVEAGPKRVVIKPKDIVFGGDTLNIR